jgi:hypothetical protein
MGGVTGLEIWLFSFPKLQSNIKGIFSATRERDFGQICGLFFWVAELDNYLLYLSTCIKDFSALLR